MFTRNSRHLGLGLAATACLTGAPAWAAETPVNPDSNARAEDIGIVTGLAVGAAAGGPIGAMIGAAAGGLMGDRAWAQPPEGRQPAHGIGMRRLEGVDLEQYRCSQLEWPSIGQPHGSGGGLANLLPHDKRRAAVGGIVAQASFCFYADGPGQVATRFG